MQPRQQVDGQAAELAVNGSSGGGGVGGGGATSADWTQMASMLNGLGNQGQNKEAIMKQVRVVGI